MVPRCRCSAKNLSASLSSSCVRGRSCPGRVFGAPGRSSIAWSHTVCAGSRWEASSLKTLPCMWYSDGTFARFGLVAVILKVTLPM